MASRHSGRKTSLSYTAPNEQELERQLKETIKRYELIFKATNDVLYDLDLTNGTIIWNEALYTQYGYTSDEPAGTLEWWTSHIHPDDAFRIENEVNVWFESRQNTWQAEYRFRKADGSYSDVRDRGTLLRAPDGTPLRIIGSFLDITHQKQLDRAKDEFISLVSHQLRTPLTVIRIYSEMLTDGMYGPLNNRQASHIRRITEASIRLIQLVGDILNASRIELGHLAVRPTMTNINRHIRERIREVLPLTAEKGIRIDFTPAPTAISLFIDGNLLDQILHNLLTNAIRYTSGEKGRIEVSFSAGQDGYLLRVHDNGIGIPRSAQPHIFNRFYRAHNAVNIEEHGTGLGLYTVKLLTDTLGGKVWFESSRQHGTTFFVLLPLNTRIN